MFKDLYNNLFDHYDDLQWWPSESDDETVIGCILTQNTSWKNVEKAIETMKKSDVITLNDVRTLPVDKLRELIRSSGFFNQKSIYLKEISNEIINNYGSLSNMKGRNIKEIEDFISGIKGVGNETKESIMLYALNYPVFVVDAYTFRFLERYYGLKFTRKEIRKITEEEFPDVNSLKNFHGMLVNLGKDFCRKQPLCNSCFLRNSCKTGKKL
ncbi:endonuclease III domain-containing protein [Ferroplasma sp.]|uniref:endonuclease III domain-containing protein n=1 Tax=Ferroplasma sp. TaxID=2591003 RepID=UPI002609C8A8|nr:endonuclease III domain-containing protein [Ferroplasma sp.]